MDSEIVRRLARLEELLTALLDRIPAKRLKVGSRPPKGGHEGAVLLVKQFRQDYQETVQADFEFGDISPAERRAAAKFLRDPAWTPARIHALKAFALTDQIPEDDWQHTPGRAPWKGWAWVIRSVANLWDKRDKLINHARARGIEIMVEEVSQDGQADGSSAPQRIA